MMGHRQVDQVALFYEFSIETHVPADHLLRSIDRFVELGELRRELAAFYSAIGRPSVDPELMMRMLIVGYCFGIRSERRLCEEVHLNLAYRWFCRLGLDGGVPDHSTFSKNRHGRFRQSDLLRRLFETVLRRCIREGLVGGEGFAVDASLIKADANRQKGIEGEKRLAPEAVGRAVKEYLAVLDDAAFGAASEVTPKFISPADPAARWTGAHGGQAFFAYSTNYLIDVENAIIVDVEATTAIRQAEVLAARRMIERSMERFDLYPARLMGDSAYGSADMLGWLVHEHGIEPHVTVFDKSARKDGTFSRDDFTYDHKRDVYVCPGGKKLTTTGTLVNDDATMLYRASKHGCTGCALKPECCPNSPTRKVPRSIHEGARDMARQIAMRERGGDTRTQVFAAENEAVATITATVAPGSVIHADEATSWDPLHSSFEVKRINHSEAYSHDGACTNQAESFFSRLRRAEVGIHHHIRRRYLSSYASEMAWRENNRRVSNGDQFLMTVSAAAHHPVSKQWKGYWQRSMKHD